MRMLMRAKSVVAVALFASMIVGTSSAEQSGGQSLLPAPTGSYSVGRTPFYWTDTSRTDLGDKDGKREIAVWIWYPAAAQSGGKKAEWMPGAWAQIASQRLKHEDGTPLKGALYTHAYDDAPIAASQEKFPVLVFGPAGGLMALQYAGIIEEIVSHGYIVAAVTPRAPTVLSDGQVHQPPGMASMAGMGDGDAIIRAGHAAYVAAMRFVLDELEKLNADATSPFRGRLDLERVGAFGNSMGGSGSLQLAKDDPRVRAAVDIDGLLPFSSDDEEDLRNGASISKPTLVLTAKGEVEAVKKIMAQGGPAGWMIKRPSNGEAPSSSNKERQTMVMKPPPSNGESREGKTMMRLPPGVQGGPPVPGAQPVFLGEDEGKSLNFSEMLSTATPGYLLELSGSMHLSSADMYALQLSTGFALNDALKPTIDGARALVVMSAYVTAFFDQHLKERPSALLEGPSSDFPEITFEKFGD